MRLIKELFWILFFSLIGEFASLILATFVIIPGSVLGMLLLFFALHFKLLKLEDVEGVGTWLTDNMAIFFVPVGVGLIKHFDILEKVWWQIIIVVLLTVSLLLLLVGRCVQFIKNKQDLGR